MESRLSSRLSGSWTPSMSATSMLCRLERGSGVTVGVMSKVEDP